MLTTNLISMASLFTIYWWFCSSLRFSATISLKLYKKTFRAMTVNIAQRYRIHIATNRNPKLISFRTQHRRRRRRVKSIFISDIRSLRQTTLLADAVVSLRHSVVLVNNSFFSATRNHSIDDGAPLDTFSRTSALPRFVRHRSWSVGVGTHVTSGSQHHNFFYI